MDSPRYFPREDISGAYVNANDLIFLFYEQINPESFSLIGMILLKEYKIDLLYCDQSKCTILSKIKF